MAKHPADGLYYVTPNMLRRTHACRAAFAALFPDVPYGDRSEARCGLTLENMTRILERTGILGYVTVRLYSGRKVTREEFDDFNTAYRNAVGSSTRHACAFMDLLHARAKREGLIP